MRQVSSPVRRGAGRKGRKDLARSLPGFNVLGVLFHGEVFPHSTKFSGGARHCSAKSPGGEDLEIQEPIPRGDCATFHFDPTLPGMLGSTLIRDQIVEVR